eukprot:TRINITY_DN94458_c0_g1_i1.p1 TRINITY_DN94458_c0_g1~~TRINITY_DN94458_c0_g1_i1.p1  ORF type:complete len:420 (-),score=79.61 TRINITY_DN94458_c0_g1_i1:173-1324(-)
MAGRSMERLEAFKKELPESAQKIPLLEVDVRNETQLAEMAKAAKVIVNYAGTPYSDKALPVVAACASTGCHYIDITGEVPFMKTSAVRYDAEAKANKALIIHACGYDSVPSDLGAMMAAQTMKDRHGVGCSKIRLYELGGKGGISGGTLHSALYMLTEGSAVENADAAQTAYGLDPPGGMGGPDTGDFGEAGALPHWDADCEAWTIPFIMAPVNARVVRRSNALSGYSYGEAMSYGESMVASGPVAGIASNVGMALGLCTLVIPPTRWALTRWVLPKPGEGPSRELQNTGYFRTKTVAVGSVPSGQSAEAPRVVISVDSGDGGDPGYKCTARMSIEAGLCCALQRDKCLAEGGVVTPAYGLGMTLVERLRASGMKFEVSGGSI